MQSFGVVLAVLILGLFTAPSNWTQLMVLAALTLASLFHWLDTAVEAGWMPEHTVGWLRKPEWATTYVAGAVQIVAYCLLELMFVFVLNAARNSHPLLASSTNRNVLARIAFSAVRPASGKAAIAYGMITRRKASWTMSMIVSVELGASSWSVCSSVPCAAPGMEAREVQGGEPPKMPRPPGVPLPELR